jgi:uncharacterized damage-inducible protein DinB
MKSILKLSIVAVALFLSLSTSGQALTKDDVQSAWNSATRRYIACAKAMPAEDYSFSPFEPVRNFADQINHISKSNIGFAKSVNAGAPTFSMPDPKTPPQDKETVISLLENSAKYYGDALSKLSDKDLEERVPWGRPGSEVMITRMKAVYIALSHLSREQGKVLMYLRAKGITPPN